MNGFLPRSTLSFLKNLKKNNNREWFASNKEDFIKIQAGVIVFIEELIHETGKFDEEILKIDPKKALFRIYRDIRFSKDKTPYKTHFAVSLGMGKGSKIAGYYLHIEPGKSFLAGGVYNPSPAVLKEIRKEISAYGDDFLKILESEHFRQNFRGLSVEQKLQRVPAGYEKDHKMAEYLKLKNYVVSYPISDEDFFKHGAAKNFALIYKSIKPLNDFLEKPFD